MFNSHLQMFIIIETPCISYFCQAQPQLQLSWAELVLFPTSAADDDDDGDDDTRNSTF